MSTLVRMAMPATGEGRRWILGMTASSRCTEMAAALVAATGRGLDAQAELVGVVTTDLPKDVAGAYGPLAGGSATAAGLATLRCHLAEIEAALASELLQGLVVAPSRVLAVGVHDPGVWSCSPGEPRGYLGLCDPAKLAELTGLNVIDAFPARDLAQGGQGGPVTAMAQWMLLRDPGRNRILLDLGRTTRLSYLPSTMANHAASRVLCFDVGPGTALLDLLTGRLTDGRHRFDPGGRFAVQGRRIRELLDHWLADPYFDRPLPRWHPRGVPAERFLSDALQMAVESGWSVGDLLCTATHLIAEMIATTLSRRLPKDTRIDEIVVTGGGQQNGMLLREIARMAEAPLVRIPTAQMPGEAIEPACVALLALLHVDQVPGNHTVVTGAEVPRLLGRLTPGAPQNWQRLLQTSAGSSPAMRPLRSAL